MKVLPTILVPPLTCNEPVPTDVESMILLRKTLPKVVEFFIIMTSLTVVFPAILIFPPINALPEIPAPPTTINVPE